MCYTVVKLVRTVLWVAQPQIYIQHCPSPRLKSIIAVMVIVVAFINITIAVHQFLRRWAFCHLYWYHNFRGRRRRRRYHHHASTFLSLPSFSRHQHRHCLLMLWHHHHNCYFQRYFVTVIVMGLIIILCRWSGNWFVVVKISLCVHWIWVRIERNIVSLRINLVVWTWLGRPLKYPISCRKVRASVKLCWTLKENMAISAIYWKGNGQLLFRARLLEI